MVSIGTIFPFIGETAGWSLLILAFLVWMDGYRKWCVEKRLPYLLNAWVCLTFIIGTVRLILYVLQYLQGQLNVGNPPHPAQAPPPNNPRPPAPGPNPAPAPPANPPPPPPNNPPPPNLPRPQPPPLPPMCRLCGYAH